VRCPPGGATAIASDDIVTVHGTSYRMDERTLGCLRQVHANPPYWKPADRCPSTLVPTLTGDAKPTREDARGCYWNDVPVACDPPRPRAADGHLTVTGHVVDVEVIDAGAVITIDRGSQDGVDRGTIGTLDGVKHGDLFIFKVMQHRSFARVKAKPKVIARGPMTVLLELPDDDLE
jgi:hypothetical protein